MQIVLKTPKGPVALPRWMPLLLLAELVVVLLVLLRGMGTEQDLTFSPAQLTNQYAETLTLTTGTDGSVTPDEARTTLFAETESAAAAEESEAAATEETEAAEEAEEEEAEDETPPPSLLVSDAFALPAGRYLVTVEYAAGQDAQLQMLPESADIIDMNVTLPATNAEGGSVTDVVWLEEADRGVRLVFGADHADWTLKNVTVHRQGWYDVTCALGWLLVFVLADLLLLAVLPGTGMLTRPGDRTVLVVLAGLVLLCSTPVLMDAVSYGFDLSFHMTRLAGVAEGLAQGQFPVRIYPNFLNGYGYASPVFYGDILLYFPALLVLAGMTLFRAYNLLLVGVNILTVAIAWWSFSRMLRSRAAALAATALYSAAYYRLFNMYYRPALGETCAQTFLPLIFYGFWALYADDVEETRRRRAWLPLALGFSGVILTHTITTELAAIMAVFTVLCCAKRAFRPQRLLTLLKGAALTVGLCAWFVLPMLQELGGDYRFRADSNAIDPGDYAISLANLLQPWNSKVDYIRLGAPLLLAAAGLLAVLVWKKDLPARGRQLGLAGLVLGTAAVLLTGFTGWETVAGWMGESIGRMFLNFQFPFRFLVFAVLGLAAAGGALVWLLHHLAGPKSARACAAGLIAVAVIFAGLDLTPYVDAQFGRSRHGTTEGLSDTTTSSAMEYLPAAFDLDQAENTDLYPSDTLSCTLVEKGSLRYTLRLVNESADQNANLELPLVYYPGYRVLENDGGAASVTEGETGQVALVVGPGYDGTLTVGFAEPLSWRAAEVVSLLTVIGLIVWGVRERKRKKA